MTTTNYKHPLPEADMTFLQDVVQTGAINYSFSDPDERVVVDFEYLCGRLDDDTMIGLTDKIKDLVMDALFELENDEEET